MTVYKGTVDDTTDVYESITHWAEDAAEHILEEWLASNAVTAKEGDVHEIHLKTQKGETYEFKFRLRMEPCWEEVAT